MPNIDALRAGAEPLRHLGAASPLPPVEPTLLVLGGIDYDGVRAPTGRKAVTAGVATARELQLCLGLYLGAPTEALRGGDGDGAQEMGVRGGKLEQLRVVGDPAQPVRVFASQPVAAQLQAFDVGGAARDR